MALLLFHFFFFSPQTLKVGRGCSLFADEILKRRDEGLDLVVSSLIVFMFLSFLCLFLCIDFFHVVCHASINIDEAHF